LDQEAAERFVALMYEHLLCRKPKPDEFRHWVTVAATKLTPDQLISAFANSHEYVERKRVRTQFPIGHYYSPIEDPSSVEKYVARNREIDPGEIAGIPLSTDAMSRFWERLLPIVRGTPFQDEKSADRRFCYNNNNFPYGDAIVLRAMLGRYRPKRVVEVGAGFSSACMLDAVDEFELRNFRLTCIEPDPVRLNNLLRPEDADRVELIASPVQEVPLDVFSELESGDILFIDSTHVLKTGSDVHYELFSVLPCLRPGVLIHFHDIQYPFEYPRKWVFENNNSWNEIYALRAFLMYNNEFRVLFWCSMLARANRPLLVSTFPLVLRNSGGSIWIEKVGASYRQSEGTPSNSVRSPCF
jgi:predicted O-methyltransferase YrrM